MPKGTTTKQLSRLTLEYIHDLKGVTVYVDGSRGEQVLNPISLTEVKKHLKKENVKESADVETTNCASGNCEI